MSRPISTMRPGQRAHSVALELARVAIDSPALTVGQQLRFTVGKLTADMPAAERLRVAAGIALIIREFALRLPERERQAVLDAFKALGDPGVHA